MSKKGYYFVTKNNKMNLVLTLVILVIFCVILAIISLLPSKFKDKWLNTDNGVARTSMFPFVYTSDNSLYILNERLQRTEVDDSVSSCIHDVNFNFVYYLRENKLYEYDIDSNSRVNLSDGVVDFKLFNERTSILCTNYINDLYLYLYKNKGNIKLNKGSLENVQAEYFYQMGNSYVVFLDDYDPAKNSASLIRSDLEGKTKCIAKGIDITKNFSISSDDEYVLFYKDNNMCISDIDGKILKTYSNATIISRSMQPTMTELCTPTEKYGDGVSFSYFLTDISESGNSGDLVYFDGEFVKVDNDIRSVVHFYDEDKLILYTKSDSDSKVSLYKCLKGSEPTKIFSCNSNDKFFYNEQSSFLYIQSSEGYLRRINIHDKSGKVTNVAEGTGVLFEYIGKSFVGYHDLDGESQFLILNTNSIEEFSMNEIRYYGKFSNKYLLCREYQQGMFSLDYTVDGHTTRIANSVDKNVFFDRELKNVIFSHENEMFLWSNGEIKNIGACTNIKAVPIISSR